MIPRLVLAVYICRCVYSADESKLAADTAGTCLSPPKPEGTHSMEDDVIFLQTFPTIEDQKEWIIHDLLFNEEIPSLDDDVMFLQTSPPEHKIRRRRIHDGRAKDAMGKSYSQRNAQFLVLSSQSNTSSDRLLLDRHGRGEFRKQRLRPELNRTNTRGKISNDGPAPHRHLQGEHMVDAYASQQLKGLEEEVTAFFEVAKEQVEVHKSSSAKASAGAVIFLTVLVIALVALLGVSLYLGSPIHEGNKKGTKLASQLSLGPQDARSTDEESRSSFIRPGSSPRVPLPQKTPFVPVVQPASRSSLPLATPQPKQQLSQSRGPPPICPVLVLPKTEARFMISMEDLKQIPPDGKINVNGASGRALLTLSLSDTRDGQKCMSLASAGCDEDPRMWILIPPPHVQGPLIMDVYAQGSALYGTLEIADRASPTTSVLKCNGQPVMQVEIVSMPEMRMNAVNLDGQTVGSGGRQTHPQFRRKDTQEGWKILVKPGEDAVLITSCMLAMLLMVP